MEQPKEDTFEDSRECEAMRKMFVGGLSRDTTEETFFNHFMQYGTMIDKVIIRDPQSKMSRGFGFITYDSSDAVENVFNGRPHVLDGKTLDVKRAMPRDYNTSSAHAKVTKLFIGGVSSDLTVEELQQYIEGRHPPSIGTVSEINLLKDKETNKNKGFGFMECSSSDFADRLTISEHSFQLNGKTMSLRKAEPKTSEGGAQMGRGGRGGVRGRGGGVRGRGRGSFGARGGSGSRGGGRGGVRGRGGFGGRGNYNNSNNSYDNSYNSGNGYNNSNGYNNDSSYNSGSGYNSGTTYNSGGQENSSYSSNYSTGYPSSNQGGYNGYQNQQSGSYGQQSSYGQYNSTTGYGNQQQGARGGYSSGGNRFTPY